MSHDVDWAALQATFALGAPVIAIGPGCHRIGYRESAEWGRVVQRAQLVWHRLDDIEQDEDDVRVRRAFLGRLWHSRVGAGAAELGGADGAPEAPAQDLRGIAPACERARIALAADLLCGLVEATRALGATVESGAVPVTDWDQLRDQHRTESKRFREHAIASLRRAVDIAADLDALQGDRSAQGPFPGLAAHGLTPADGDDDALQLLKAERIHASLDDLVTNCLDAPGGHISGAMVEWLSDLFWHVLVCGAGVPPSQDELNFYLNLAIPDPEMRTSERRFSRPHPGEYRGKADGGTKLRDDLGLLLGDCDAGLARGRDWRAPRQAFARTMAASLLETWRTDERHRLTIGLVSDYDLLLERAMLELVDEGEGFHVLIPAVTNPGERTPSFAWLYGTIRRSRDAPETDLLRPRWQWFSVTPNTATAPPLGPILIRLTGSPLHPLGSPAELDLPDSDSLPYVSELAAAALFSEHDSVRAIVALTQPRPPGQQSGMYLHDDLFNQNGLAWTRRGWLFFGHRFSDWLPRLQLLFTALMLGRDGAVYKAQSAWGERKGEPSRKDRIAVARRFDWPEEALLHSLTIDMQEVDLERVSRYHGARSSHHGSSKPEAAVVLDYLDRVDRLVGKGLDPSRGGKSSNADPASGRAGDGERPNPKVFISYSHEGEPDDSPWNSRVRSLADLLATKGIDVRFDAYGTRRNRDWSVWGANSVAWADAVVCVASPQYARDWEDSGGSGAATEARAIRSALQRQDKTVLFVLLPGRSGDDIPAERRGIHYVRVGSFDSEGIEELLRELTDQPAWPAPPVGSVPDLPPKR